MHGYTRMILAEDAPIDIQRPLVGLFGQCPLLLPRINLREIIQQRGYVGRRSLRVLHDIEATFIQSFRVAELALLMPQPPKLPYCATGFPAGRAEFGLR